MGVTRGRVERGHPGCKHSVASLLRSPRIPHRRDELRSARALSTRRVVQVIVGTHDTARRPLLIAEIGNNHEGDPGLALELAEAAVAAGADAVKVQIIDPGRLVNVAQSERIAQLTRFRLDPEVFVEMAQRVRSHGRLFMASVFDCASLREMQHQLDAIKIASGDLNFDPLLEIAGSSGRPVILSTGMSTMD